MATNNFKAFALDPNANVMSQADWEALPALLSGFTAGKASSAQVNKAIRQATTIAALVGQFIANSGADALDNADVNGLVTKFTNALTTNLSLGTASKRNVGTGANQIPDMSSFTGDFSQAGYASVPGGLIIQWGGNSGSSQYTPLFKIPFPSRCIQIVASVDGGKDGVDINSRSMVEVGDITKTGFSATVFNAAGSSQQLSNRAIHWMALGV
ncbi:gp53-like domain-containing protein [Escherichia coli]|uniref:gp53-like domain-containing protein n=1 Tax=Escherichia coli TaxID=562 RepID=UPI003A972ACA